MWFFKKIVDVYYIILFEWFEIFFVSGIFNRMVIILIYLLQKNGHATKVEMTVPIVRLLSRHRI